MHQLIRNCQIINSINRKLANLAQLNIGSSSNRGLVKLLYLEFTEMCTKTVFSISIKLLKQKVVRIGADSSVADGQ